jgi:tRNA nucleotidyltransferase/poly(A) polymerase
MDHLVPAKQRQFAIEVVEELRGHGFTAYWAGGCVRDHLLSRTPWDYDVATDAKPDEIRRLFGRRRTLTIGAVFGVIAVVGPREAGQVEVTTFRRDAAYLDGRHPESVSFSSPEEDAKRRDFTINGMFFDPLADEVIDFVGGAADVRDRIVRAIGEPRERFAEDKLRLLRGVRFAAIFAFNLDSATEAAIREMASQITVVSPERIAIEMEIMLLDANRTRAVRLLDETGLLAAILPEAASGEALERTLLLLDRLNEPTFPLALAVLLHTVGKPDVAIEVGRRWRLPTRVFERANWLLAHWDALAGDQTQRWSRLQRLLISEGIGELLDLHDALAAVGSIDPADVAFCRHRLALPPHELNPPPLITGNDLVSLGIPRGKIYSEVLETIRDAQLDRKIHTREDALQLVGTLWNQARGSSS